MRFLAAILAVLGLLITPVAAAAGAAACLHHAGDAMATDAPSAAHMVHTADHSCCDEGGAPAKHDSKSCAQACAAMCIASVALADDALTTLTLAGRLHIEPAPFKAFLAHAPPGLKRPPRTVA